MVSTARETTDSCESCGIDLRAMARFCDVCGAPVSPRSLTGEHKQVTVLFMDVVGSMKLAAALDAERLREIMTDLFNGAAAVVQRYQGTVDKFTGDGLMALFGAPVALEDHPLRACIAALEIQAVSRQLADEVQRRDGVALQLRVGLNSGDVIVGEIGSGPGRYTAIGHTVGMAQRMESVAPPGGVMCSYSTSCLVEGAVQLGPVEAVAVKGGDEKVPGRLLLGVESDRMVVGRNEGLMLGRDVEMSQLQNIFRANGGLVGIVGAPGLGKSRLMGEFTALVGQGGADVVVARCDAHTATLPFLALSRLLRAMFKTVGLSDADARAQTMARCGAALTSLQCPDAQILFDAMGIADADAAQPAVSFDGRRRRLVDIVLKSVLAQAARTVFVLEDIHWIDAPSDEVLADLAVELGATASMFVVTYRPECRGVLQQQCNRSITLEPLPDSVAAQQVSHLLGTNPSLNHLAARIAIVAAGNPFFAEEIVRDLAGRGVLTGSRGGYRLADVVDEIAVPATVQAVLAARIDRLPAAAKSMLNAAAVIGADFDMDILLAVVPEAEPTSVADLLSNEFIDQTRLVPRQRYCFRHPLVRTVAYESQLSANRRRTHHSLASAIAVRDPADADENAALIAEHYEAAGELIEAHRWHMRSANWLRPRDLPAARGQWESARRIADALPDDQRDVAALRIAPRTMLVSTAMYVGNDFDAEKNYLEFRSLAVRNGDLTSLALGTAGRVMSLSLNENRVPEAVSLAAELESLVGEIECDVATRSIILTAVAFARFTNCEFDVALRVIDSILDLPQEESTMELAVAETVRGYIEVCRGDYVVGRQHLRDGTVRGRALGPLNHAILLIYSSTLVALGIYVPDEFVDEVRDALERAEAFGDVCGLITAQCAYGTVLLRADNASRAQAIEVLNRADSNIQKHNVFTLALGIIGADLAVDAARDGRLDEAIDALRNSFLLHSGGGFRVFAGCVGEALVGLLIERGRQDDLIEVRQIVARWQDHRHDIPAMDLVLLKAQVLLATAEKDWAAYAEFAHSYLKLCQELDARGRLDEARRLVGRIA
ncbi:adenylate/guanylate cyclase domain-containing protein [Mycobacterium sp. EPa45]|uniref:ATP-binding protein n=1 Tax=Mycobacterium sp. EPa45 TaxID=1545728 RepID=UPI00064268E1|nr:adenylate/guanylate cyclase domain-containing protein [Mycobacterium sp. EPa45]AKK27150.1 adenylyl cyclase [Mycobacterium sp. EPa45]